MDDRVGRQAERPLNVVLIDGDRPARSRLKGLLKAIPGIWVTGEAVDLSGGRALVTENPPDVVFLDTNLSGESGFDLLPSLSSPTRIVFVTAHDEYAAKAFQVNALDYLLKPVATRRLATAVARAREQRHRSPAPPAN